MYISVDDLVSNVGRGAGGGKRDVEIISGRDRRLQGEGEETGARLQRDRSGVSEMEPLPATQDALRLELRPAEAWNYATLRLCRRLTRRDSAPNDGRSSRRPPCRVIVATFVVDDVVIVVIVFTRVFGLLVSSLASAGYSNPPPADFTPITFDKNRGNPSGNHLVLSGGCRQPAMSIVFY